MWQQITIHYNTKYIFHICRSMQHYMIFSLCLILLPLFFILVFLLGILLLLLWFYDSSLEVALVVGLFPHDCKALPPVKLSASKFLLSLVIMFDNIIALRGLPGFLGTGLTSLEFLLGSYSLYNSCNFLPQYH